MGSGEEWANDGKAGCPIALAGIVSGVLLVLYGIAVVIVDIADVLVP